MPFNITTNMHREIQSKNVECEIESKEDKKNLFFPQISKYEIKYRETFETFFYRWLTVKFDTEFHSTLG